VRDIAIGVMARRALVDVMKRLHSRGLVNIRGGNASIKLELAPGYTLVYITPSGKPKDILRETDIAVISLEGEIVEGKPSSEYRLHIEVYRRRREARAVVHAHSPLTLAAHRLGLLGKIADRYVEASYYVGCVEVVGMLSPGSMELARSVGEKAAKCNAIILEGHGVVAIGSATNPVEAVYEALDRVEALEDLSRIALAETYRRIGHS